MTRWETTQKPGAGFGLSCPRCPAALLAGEVGRALAQERGDALDEVGALRELALDRRLQLQVRGHPVIQPVVQLALAARVGAGRAGTQPVQERVRLLRELR